MICPYCKQPARFVDNAEIYGKRYGRFYMAFWCQPCDAMVGVHENDPARPLGTMANKELRQWRIKAHAAFDPFWQLDPSSEDGDRPELSRSAVYAWLSEIIGEEVHVGQSDVQRCAAIIAAAGKIRESLDQQYADEMQMER